MTQTQSLTTLATRPSSGRKGWSLQIYDPKGQERLVTYDSATNPGVIHEGFNSRRYPNNTCGPGSFLAVPKFLIGGDPRNIVKLSYDTGTKVVPAYFGYIAKAPDPRKGEISKYELTSGKELLKNSPIPDTFDTNFGQEVDASVWLNHFVGLYRHEALKYDSNLIPLTSVMFSESMYDAAGSNLYEVMAAIIKGCPNIKDNEWGVNPEGYVVVQQATGSYTLTGDDAALKYGDRDGEQICTQAKIKLTREVSEGAVVSAGYRPRLVAYTHTDPAHIIYGAPVSFELPKKKDDTPILEVLSYSPRTGFSWGGTWYGSTTSSFLSVSTVAQDGDLNTYAYPNTTSPGDIALQQGDSSRETTLVGAALVIDAPAGTYDLTLRLQYQTIVPIPGGSPSVINRATILFDLNALKGKGKVEVRRVAPPPVGVSYIHLGKVSFLSTDGFPTTLKLYELRGLCINEGLVSQIAQSNIRLPARQVSQITFANTVTESGVLGGYLLETPVKTLKVPGEDGKLIECEVTEYNDTCTTVEGILTRAETGEPIRNPIVNTINDAIYRAMEDNR